MNCKDTLEIAPLYLSCELGASRMAEVRRHLETCSPCAAEFADLRDLDARIREAALAEEIDTGALEQRIRERTRPSRAWIGIAAAIVVGVAAFWSARATQDKTCIAAATDHRREVVNGEHRTWLSEAAAIAELAGGRGIFLPQLSSAGYQLERGKLCRLNGRVFLHLVYRNPTGELSMFIAPGDGSSSGIRDTDSGNEHTAKFLSPRAEVIVVTEQSGEAANEMARFAARVL